MHAERKKAIEAIKTLEQRLFRLSDKTGELRLEALKDQHG